MCVSLILQRREFLPMKSKRSNLKPRVIICARILPVHLEFNSETKEWICEFENRALFQDGPIYHELAKAILSESIYDVCFIGCPPVFVQPRYRVEVMRLLSKKNCYPIFLNQKVEDDFFRGYCKQILWPVLHNVVELPSIMGNDENSPPTYIDSSTYWPAFSNVNSLFARKVVEVYSFSDVVWIQDYHLMLIPGYLMRKLPQANVALFVHTPFPSSEVFRYLHRRDDILRAMLCADHIGFHLFEYSRHFSNACKRMLGASSEMKSGGASSIKFQGREIILSSVHVGGNPHALVNMTRHPLTIQMAKRAFERRRAATGKGEPSARIILGIDEVETAQGLSLKFQAFYMFLKKRREAGNTEKVILRQVGVTSFACQQDYSRASMEAKQMIKYIQDEFGDVVEYEEVEEYDIRKRVAAYFNADVLLVTSVFEGLNMTPLEYSIAKKMGVLILSEFCPASRILLGAIKIHPRDLEGVAWAIDNALTMTDTERQPRNSRNMSRISGYTMKSWAASVLYDITQKGYARSPNALRESFGLGVAVNAMTNAQSTSSRQLDCMKVRQSFKDSKKRVLFVDYSGTLVEQSALNMYTKAGARSWRYESGGQFRPNACRETRDPIPDSLVSTLKNLTSDPKNLVILVSSDLRHELALAVEKIPKLGLIAENGYVFRLSPEDPWEVILQPEADMGNWQQKVSQVMEPYRLRTTSSFVWKAPSAVSFNTVMTDYNLAHLQAGNLYKVLDRFLSEKPLVVEQGNGYITVRLKGVDRGAAATMILDKVNKAAAEAGSPSVDFILGFGDDSQDEPLFEELYKHKGRKPVFTVKVGERSYSTKARYFLKDRMDVETILSDFANDYGSATIRQGSSLILNEAASNFQTKRTFAVSLNRQAQRNALTERRLSTIIEDRPAPSQEATASMLVEDSSGDFDSQISMGVAMNDIDMGDKQSKKISSDKNKKHMRNHSQYFNQASKPGRSSLVRNMTVSNFGDLEKVRQRRSVNMARGDPSPSFVPNEEEMEKLFGKKKQMNKNKPVKKNARFKETEKERVKRYKKRYAQELFTLVACVLTVVTVQIKATQ